MILNFLSNILYNSFYNLVLNKYLPVYQNNQLLNNILHLFQFDVDQHHKLKNQIYSLYNIECEEGNMIKSKKKKKKKRINKHIKKLEHTDLLIKIYLYNMCLVLVFV